MVIFKNADQIAAFLSGFKKNEKTLGFVPTMGALHQGHASLIETCKQENDVTICSIFINPAQFNNKEDFKHYPVKIEKDIELLISKKCDVLFLPAVDEIYPPGYEKKIYPLGKIETILEGEYRPGHFQGVCAVIDRLLDIIKPHNIYLGQKDYQQCMVVQKLLELKGVQNEYQLIVEPTIREVDGLAMSSRNLRLSEEDRAKAPSINEALENIKNKLGQLPMKTLKQNAKIALKEKGFQVDYVEIADASTLEPANGQTHRLVALIAATIGNIRLIDNKILN